MTNLSLVSPDCRRHIEDKQLVGRSGDHGSSRWGLVSTSQLGVLIAGKRRELAAAQLAGEPAPASGLPEARPAVVVRAPFSNGQQYRAAVRTSSVIGG